MECVLGPLFNLMIYTCLAAYYFDGDNNDNMHFSALFIIKVLIKTSCNKAVSPAASELIDHRAVLFHTRVPSIVVSTCDTT